MPIDPIVLQRQMRELGRIRIGAQVDAGNGRRRPTKLATFRLTTSTRSLLDAAATVYGGRVEPWDQQWELVTETDVLDIVVPPGAPVSQWLELWKAGGCVRRCDGVTESISGRPCLCPKVAAERVALAKDGEACKATTRLNVMLPSLPDLGVWRLESHGYYAAVELAGAADVLAAAASAGVLIPARLRIDQRSVKRPGEGLREYAVPVIEFASTSLGELRDAGMVPMLGSGSGSPPAPRGIPALPPGPLEPTSDLRGPAAPEISTDELLAGVRALGVDVDDARLLANEVYGAGTALTGAQRYDFLTRLRARADRDHRPSVK